MSANCEEHIHGTWAGQYRWSAWRPLDGPGGGGSREEAFPSVNVEMMGPTASKNLLVALQALFELDTPELGVLVVIHVMNIRHHGIMQSKKPRNPADYPVLGVLFRGPAHGYDLCRELKERLGEVWKLHTSHIYALLAGLEKDGLVRHERIDQETRPAKKVFSITDEGRLLFLVWVRSPVTNVRDIRLEFLAKLYFSRFDSPTALGDLVSNQLSVCRSNMKRLVNGRRLCKTDTERAALDYRLAMLSAVEAWLLGLNEPHHDSGGGFEGPHTSRDSGDSGVSV